MRREGRLDKLPISCFSFFSLFGKHITHIHIFNVKCYNIHINIYLYIDIDKLQHLVVVIVVVVEERITKQTTSREN